MQFEARYGARKKGNWPSLSPSQDPKKPSEKDLFVSPLDPQCTQRFAFKQDGTISPTAPDDGAAMETIARLGLNDGELVALRERAIRGALYPCKRWLTPKETRKLLRELKKDATDLDQGHSIRLRPFCFAIEQAVERRVRKLEGFPAQK
ncbi:hypothetical protein [Chondromyces apiculatus]|uniref:Uncharacterized protein n=1 Tax=Chondromyces apiculatus DSM 436 TaxID=1192034 RepID=A0A017SUW0_9BACT|nr:hypothetical protein [Chondromyces apiculatus]EYF00046.1 Hypothetical protein CAP_1594 [Chondromyces apiculatus DSM 436]